LDDSPDGLEALIEQHKSAVERSRSAWLARPEVAVVSGSGLGIDLGERRTGRPTRLSPPFLPSGRGHQHLVEMFEPLPGRHVLYYRGRLHSYQGYSANDTVFPVRLAALLGAKVLVMTNARAASSPTIEPAIWCSSATR